MSSIVYRRADYSAPDERVQILRLYREVFRMDFTMGYDMWFCNEARKAVGIIALDAGSSRIVGHWALAHFEASVGGEIMGYRQSLGTMTDAEYRGRGIAATLFQHLRQTVEDEGGTRFIVGFPNEASYKLLLNQLGFVWKRDYHFVVLPRGSSRFQYQKEKAVCKRQIDVIPGKNCLLHTPEYMEWHYQRQSYDIWLSEKGRLFISVRFRDKADIVYWSYDTTGEELLDFSSFLYKSQDINKVTTWNSTDFLDTLPREERNYHMCIQYLNSTPAEQKRIGGEWFCYMGDCDLY